jgi:hypothetical protein
VIAGVLNECIQGHRLGKPVALDFIAAFLLEEPELIFTLHPFGSDHETEVFG